MKREFAIAILLLFSLTMMGKIRDTYYPWGELELHINALNFDETTQRGLRITAWIPELGIYGVSTNFDLDDDERTSRIISLNIPSYAEGNSYLVRLVLSNDDVKDVRYIWATLY